MNDIHKFYNAIALHLEGNYSAINRIAKKYEEDWTKAWEELAPTSIVNANHAFETLKKYNVRLILQSDSEYPPPLREITHPPFGIYVRGILPQHTKIHCAIVGTRKATEEGIETAREFAQALTPHDVVIVSGLAIGIDSAAHRGCLATGGTTIAVLANGLDSIYPRHHARLGEEIVKSGGALISEYPIGSPSYPTRFLERNRIVSGLSKCVLVIEAPERSGSLATARFALDQNRTVCVIPGSIRHINFRGSHDLIRSGATLVRTPEDLFEELGIESINPSEASYATNEERRVIEFLKATKKAVVAEEIIANLALDPALVLQTLSFLQIKNIITENTNGYRIHTPR